MPNELLLDVQKLSFQNNRLRPQSAFLKNISFQVFCGEIIGIVGESGSGKSNLADLLLGFQPCKSGKIVLQDRPIHSHPHYRRMVQGVLQNPYQMFNPFQSISEQLRDSFNLFAEKPSDSEIDERIHRALQSIDLSPERFLNANCTELSQSQLQRISLARIQLIKPSLLIADEPTTFVDLGSRWKILDYMQQIRNQSQMSIILLTQDISQAFFLCTRVLVLCQGEIIEQGPTREVILKPRHPYTQRLLRDIPRMNQPWFDRESQNHH